MDNFNLQSPWLLIFLLLGIPAIWQMIRYVCGKVKGSAKIRYSSLSNIKNMKKRKSRQLRILLPILRTLALLFFIIALARPQTGKTMTEVSTEAVDILLVMDTSGSMEALDFYIDENRVTRLTAVKHVVENFIKNRPTDRMGMIVFGEEAFTQCPQTLDHGVLLAFLDEIEIGMAGDATALGSAIGVGTKRLKELKSKSKVMILLTDGRNNAGFLSPVKASELAKTFGIKIYTIGVGSKGKAPFMVKGFFGKQLVYQQVDLDEETLQKIASLTGGQYFRATDTESLVDIYKEIDEMEKTSIKLKKYLDYNEHFPLFLTIGFLFLFTEIILGNTRLRKIP